MTRIRGIRRLFHLRDSRDATIGDVDQEMRFHVESRVDELVARGVSLDDARRTALAEFGDWRRYRADTFHIDQQRAGEVRMKEFGESVLSDVSYAGRCLRRAPAFTAVATVTLALGIGATTAVFSAVSGVLLRPLPFADAARIVHVGERDEARPTRGGTTSYENFDDWRRMSRSFDAMGLYSTFAPTLTGRGDPERVPLVKALIKDLAPELDWCYAAFPL